MDTATIRKWIDEAGLAEVARRSGASLDAVGRWAGGRPIPKTRHEALRLAKEAWEAEQASREEA